MKIPEKIKIGGFDWSIEENAKVAYEGNIYGSTHIYKQSIFLDPDAPQQKKEQTLIHEIMHALWWQQGFTERYKGDSKVIEEEIIQGISMGLYQVLKDNDFLK